MGMYKIQLYIENILGSIQNKKPIDVGEVSDGHHTFNELYRYRMLYNAAFFNLLARSGQVEVCKSRRHSDGEKCFGSDEMKYSLFMEGGNQGVSISGISTEKIQKMFHTKSLNSLEGRGIRLY